MKYFGARPDSDTLISHVGGERVSPTILVSLRKSAVRRNVLDFLVSIHPAVAYTSEISRAVGYGSNQVYGALLGLKDSYEPNNSLCALGLVEKLTQKDQNRIVYYRATRLGCLMSSATRRVGIKSAPILRFTNSSNDSSLRLR